MDFNMLRLNGFNISFYKRLSVSSCASVYYFEEEDKKYIAKVSTNEMASLEVDMNNYLEKMGLMVPKVVKLLEDTIVYQYIENDGVIDDKIEIQIAKHLINLHSNSSEMYGFEINNIIGTSRQYNTKHSNWIEFFASERLRKFANNTYDCGAINLKLLTRIENFSQKLDKYLIQPKKPSLLHGDIWSGNILTNNGQLKAFIDPAPYYGHNEIELAFINMFDTLGDSFYKEYTNSIKIESEFKTREMIYNIYPNLVHAKSFGGFYITNIDNTLKYFGY
jgi:fructosamine-3-kinase